MISIIIVNHKQRKFTEECAASIVKNLQSEYEIIVINNSPEEKLNIPSAQIIESDNNGFSSACNLGGKTAKGKYLLFLNADTVVNKDFSIELLNASEKLEFGAFGLKLYNPDGTPQLSFWKENTFLNEIKNKKAERLFAKRDKSELEKFNSINIIKEVDWVTGASLFVRKDVFDSLGGFDEMFFMFYEDADLCKRLSNNGYKIYFYPFSNITHYKGENVNPAFTSSTYYYAKESQLLYYSKHNGFIDNVVLRVYLLIKFLIKYLSGFKDIDLKILKLTSGLNR